MRRKISFLLLFLTFFNLIPQTIFAEGENGSIHKVLINSYVISWAENGKNYYANIDGNKKTHANPGSNVSVRKDLNNIDLTHIATPDKMEFVSVESYNGSNFDFNSPNNHWNAIPGLVENKGGYDANYLKISGQNINYSNAVMKNGKFSSGYSLTLTNLIDEFNFAKQIRAGIISVDDIYNRFGGAGVVDPSMRNTLEEIRRNGVDSNDSGYIYVIPTILTLKVKDQNNIVAQNIRYTLVGNKLTYSADIVLLEGAEKIDNVEILGNVTGGSINKTDKKLINLEKKKPKRVEYTTELIDDVAQGTIIIEANQSKKIPESTYDDNKVQAKFARQADLEVVSIESSEYPANNEVSAYVRVRNNSDADFSSDVRFQNGIINQKVNVNLKARAEEILEFKFKTPNQDTKITMKAEINEARQIVETDYGNNIKQIQATIVKDDAPDSNCSVKKTWTETDWRMETERYSCRKNGKSRTCTRQVKKYYKFTYEATISGDIKMIEPKNGKLKAGYGFKVQVDSKVSYKQTSGAWSRSPKQKPSAPSKCDLKTSWRVKKIIKQPQTIALQQHASGNLMTTFITPVNPASKTKAKVIYTDIDLEGTANRTKKHGFTVVVYANSPGGVLCKSLNGNIEIYGDMYEDYRVN